MPLKPEIFHGRDDFVKDIARSLLQEETSRVCILGPGGMGKTSVTLAVVELPVIKERFLGGNCVWVPCIEATSATLFLEILHIQLQVPVDGDKQVTLEKIISALDGSKEPRLILLDNFETPWNAPGGTQKQVSDILRKLVMLSHIAIFVTMRGTYPPCDTIEWQSHLLIKQPAVVHSTTSIRVRRMTPMSTIYWLHWATCLLRSHSWPIWGSEGNRRQKNCWRCGTLPALTCSLSRIHPKRA